MLIVLCRFFAPFTTVNPAANYSRARQIPLWRIYWEITSSR